MRSMFTRGLGIIELSLRLEQALLPEFAHPEVSGPEMVAVRHNQPTHYEVLVAHPVRRVHPRHEPSYRMLACV